MEQNEEWGIQISCRFLNTTTSFVLTDEMLINCAFGPWVGMSIYCEELVTRWEEPDVVRFLQWDIQHVCRPSPGYNFQNFQVVDGFMCGRFDPDLPLNRALAADQPRSKRRTDP